MRKRKTYDDNFKARVALEAIKGERTISKTASQFEVADDPIDNLVIIYERDVGKVLDIHSFAGEHQEPLFPTVGTPDAGKPAHWIATVQIAL